MSRLDEMIRVANAKTVEIFLYLIQYNRHIGKPSYFKSVEPIYCRHGRADYEHGSRCDDE